MKEQIEEMAKTICGNCKGTSETCVDLANSMVCEAVLKDAEHLYNAGYRKQEWISVEDRLPEKEEIILCCLGLVQNVYTYKGDNTWEDSYGYYQKDEPITHWMPLPQPPKMKGGAEC